MPEITKVNVGGTTYDIADNTKVSKTGDTMSGTLTIDKSGGIQFNYNDAYARLNLIGYNGTTPTSYTPRLQVLGGGGSTYGVQIEGLATPSVDSAAANKKYVDQKVASAIGDITGVEFNTDYSSYADLPTTGEAGVIYLIPNSGSAPNIYDEYIYTSNGYEKIGTTETDLSGYVPTTRTINGKALTTNISLTAADVGASATGHTHDYSKVTFAQTNTSGDEIGKITIDGETTTLYAPSNEGINIGDDYVNWVYLTGSTSTSGATTTLYAHTHGLRYNDLNHRIEIGGNNDSDPSGIPELRILASQENPDGDVDTANILIKPRIYSNNSYLYIPNVSGNKQLVVGELTKVGSITTPVYMDSTGELKACTGLISSQVTVTAATTTGTTVGIITVSTNGTTTTTTLYADANTDTKVTQTNTSSASYPIIAGYTTTTGQRTEGVRKHDGLNVNLSSSGYVATGAATGVGSAATPIYMDASGVLTACSGWDTNTDTKVTQTLTTPTASATYPILFTNTASKSATSTDTARFDTGFHYNPYFGSVFTKGPASTSSSSASGYRLGLESGTQTGAFVNGVAGTTTTTGQARLFLGNDIASGTANNAEGSIMLYGSSTNYTQIKSAAADGNKVVTFPNLGGTVVLLENPQTFTGAKTFNATTTLNNRIVGKLGTPSAGNYTTTVPSAAGVNGQIMFVTIS